jgi:hypothetical protein
MEVIEHPWGRSWILEEYEEDGETVRLKADIIRIEDDYGRA